MRFFLSFLQSPERYPIPAYDFWLYYIKNGLEEAGHQIMECPHADWAKGLVPQDKTAHQRWMADTWEKTLQYIRKNPPDIFLSYLYPQQIDTAALAEIKKMGIPCVNFFCDHVREFTFIPKEYAIFDLNWVPEYQALDLYHKAGYPYIHLPMPMWVHPLRRKITAEKNQQVTFIGSGDLQRRMLLEGALTKSPSLPLSVHGGGWAGGPGAATQKDSNYSLPEKLRFNLRFIKEQGFPAFKRKLQQRRSLNDNSAALNSCIHGSLDAEVYNELIASSMITLGINRYPSFRFPLHAPDKYSRLRDLEAPMLGACYLTEWTPGISELYDIGKEIAVYHNESDLIEQINSLRADPDKRKMLKRNGQQKALTAHTIPVSLQKLLNRLAV